MAEFEVRVDGLCVAATSGEREIALAEAMSYYSLYAETGESVELVEIVVLIFQAPKEQS